MYLPRAAVNYITYYLVATTSLSSPKLETFMYTTYPLIQLSGYVKTEYTLDNVMSRP